MKRIWRVHHADLARHAGELLLLSPEEAHHVRQVLRLKDGDPLLLFDGQGAEWRAVVTGASKSGVEVRLLEPSWPVVEAPLPIAIFQGMCRSDRMEWAIQKCTELGVSAIHPLRCEREEGRRLTPERLARWQRIAVEAAKQSGRTVVPRVSAAEQLPPPDAGGPLALLLSTGGLGQSLGELLAGERPSAVWLAVGPEAGFSRGEADGWVASGWRRTSLGPRILRAETAGLAAAAIILHLWGDLGSPPG